MPRLNLSLQRRTTRLWRLGGLMAALLVSSCGDGDSAAGPEAAADPQRWRTPPIVDRVEREPGVMILSGRATPGARVVMRGPDGVAHAATATAEGRFLLRLRHGGGDLALTAEDQAGEEGLRAPESLLILAVGPALALSPGAPTRRLDVQAGLGAIDGDGRMAVLSGRSPEGAAVTVRLGQGAEMTVTPDATGAWALRVDAARLDGEVTVDGVVHRPVLPAPPQPRQATEAGSGWSLGWASPDGAEMATWIPRSR